MIKRRIKVIGTGLGLPEKKLFAEEIDQQYGLEKGTSEKQTGIASRFQSTSETAAQLGAKACKTALADSGLNWSDIDCLVATSATMDKALPYNAAMIHAELGLDDQHTPTFDIGASCMSFLVGLDMMSLIIESGRFKNIMLVSSDISTFTVDIRNFHENGIFGDGAAAVVVRAVKEGENSHILHSKFATVSKGVDFCRINAAGSRYHNRPNVADANGLFQMNGRAVYTLAARELPKLIDELLAEANLTINDIDFFVPHQASRSGLDHMIKRLGIPKDKFVDVLAEFGNQVGASLPTALHMGISSKKINRGDKVMLLGTGAGLTIGGMILTY